MSKTMQYAMDTAENSVEQILKSLKGGNIDEVKAEKEILNVSNIDLLGIDENTVGDVIYETLNGQPS